MKKSWSVPEVNLPQENIEEVKPDQIVLRCDKHYQVPKHYKGRFSFTKLQTSYDQKRCVEIRFIQNESIQLDLENISYSSLQVQDVAEDFNESGHVGAIHSSVSRDLIKGASDRNEFHRKMQSLLILNSSLKLKCSEHSKVESVRKHSRQVFLVGPCRKKYKLSDVLWLQLQAIVAGRPMKSLSEQWQSIQDQDQYLVRCRERQKCVLKEIRLFVVPSSCGCGTDSSLTEASFRESMKCKLKAVRLLLQKYEDFEALFPNFDTLQKAYPLEMDEVVRDRLSLLYMWYNMTLDLYARISEVGIVLGLNRYDYSLKRLSSCPKSCDSDAFSPSSSWPTLDSPKECDVMTFKEAVVPSVDALQNTPPADTRSCTFSDLPILMVQSDNFYTNIVSRSLQLKGMRKILKKLDSICSKTLKKAVNFFHNPSDTEAAITKRFALLNEYMPITTENYHFMGNKLCFRDDSQKGVGAHRYSVHHEQFHAMSLPSFEKLFLFLVRVPLDLVYEWLRMRAIPQSSSDSLTLQTMIEDYHDCLSAAVGVKHNYIKLVQSAGLDSSTLLQNLAPFEDDLGDVFKTYLYYIRTWTLVEIGIEGLGAEWSERFVQNLLHEWTLAKRFAIDVICGESEVVHRFCVIGVDLLEKMVINYLIDRGNINEDSLNDFDNVSVDSSLCDAEFGGQIKLPSQIFIACRYFKSLVVQVKERSLRALSFIRTILNDVEICSLYKIVTPDIRTLIDELYVTKHSLVDVPIIGDQFIIFCNGSATERRDFVQLLLNITCSRYKLDLPPPISECVGYLLIFPVTILDGLIGDNWKGNRIFVNLDADTEISLRYLQFNADACLVSLNGVSLPKMRALLSKSSILKNSLMLLEEQSSCHEIVTTHVELLKDVALRTCEVLWDTLAGSLFTEIMDGRSLNSLDQNEIESVKATVIQAYNLAFEFHREVFRFVSRNRHRCFAERTLERSKQWADFVSFCAYPGDGSIPLWALHSFHFFTFASDPQLTSLLTDTEYKELVNVIEQCIEHIIGTTSETKYRGGLKCDERGYHLAGKLHSEVEGCETAKVYSPSVFPGCSQINVETRLTRIQTCIDSLDKFREKNLKAENRIGRVRSNGRHSLSLRTFFDPKKRAPFEWQRLEKKIGSGKFGTVYVVMNLTDQCLMAMKQIKIERNHRMLHALVDEVENLRSLDHPNLVKYYAVEVHREELFIFMEYCPEGTLETVCREGFLDMRCVRRYTHFLLRGVAYIHKKLIVHRDIKPANIFLGKKDVLKLGDFGSSVRLKDFATANGEIADWVGTPAYMAPEVHTLGKGDLGAKDGLAGYGRAADIWSVGCVIFEMCTGKPPWNECDQFFQIVFRVGSGMRPTIPQHIQIDEHCYSFLDKCFQVKPEVRANAEQLLQHPFANISFTTSNSMRGFRNLIRLPANACVRWKTNTTIPTTTEDPLKKVQKVGPDMFEVIDINDLPRAQKRFAKQFDKANKVRIKEIFERNYKNHKMMAALLLLVVSIYFYTMYAVKQESFLEEIDEEVAEERKIMESNKT